MRFIWQSARWPRFTWDASALAPALEAAAFQQGRYLGMLSEIGFDVRAQTSLESLSSEIVQSAAIEGECLNRDDVRSSVARRLEIVLREGAVGHPSPALDARVEMMLDATRNWAKPLTLARLKAWHAALFPNGYAGLVRIRAGRLRDDRDGPMRVVSRHGMLERVHFEAPPADRLKREVPAFLAGLAAHDAATPPLVRTALAHLHFLTLHPFEDGNGRLARALTEHLLARAEQTELRFYSLSDQIQREKSSYYEELEHAQRNTLDVTRWVGWFLGLHTRAVARAETSLGNILAKARFWRRHEGCALNDRQRQMVNRLWDGFEGHLTSSKWAKIGKVSQDTASREIAALVALGLLRQEGRGRATHYVLVP